VIKLLNILKFYVIVTFCFTFAFCIMGLRWIYSWC